VTTRIAFTAIVAALADSSMIRSGMSDGGIV
jgi:hypothetical protein